MNASNNGYWVLVQMWILERLPKPGPRQQQIANRWPVKMNNLCCYSLGENDNFPIFTDFYRFFGLSWETSTLKNYHPEDSKRSGSGRIEFSSKSATFLM